MPVVPKIISNTPPSCRTLNGPHLGCVVKQLYQQVNANYQFLESGIDDLIQQIYNEISIDGATATTGQIDDLFNGG